MAFSKRIGSLMSQSLTQSNVSLFNAVRCMSTKLFVGGLSFSTNDQSLKDAFSSFGEVTEARVVTDRETGRSRGFGFVNYSTEDSATEALSAMDGKEVDGRSIGVRVATERPPRTPRGPGGGGFGGSGGY